MVLSSDEKEKDFRYIVHMVQLGADSAFIEYEFDKFVAIKANGNDNNFEFKIKVSSCLILIIFNYDMIRNENKI